jgi:ATP-dependent Clp protease ATP-binding subunit ClpA
MRERGIRLTYERDIADIIARHADERGSGARGIQRVVEELIAVPVSDMLINTTEQKQTWLHIENQHGKIILGWV